MADCFKLSDSRDELSSNRKKALQLVRYTYTCTISRVQCVLFINVNNDISDEFRPSFTNVLSSANRCKGERGLRPHNTCYGEVKSREPVPNGVWLYTC